MGRGFNTGRLAIRIQQTNPGKLKTPFSQIRPSLSYEELWPRGRGAQTGAQVWRRHQEQRLPVWGSLSGRRRKGTKPRMLSSHHPHTRLPLANSPRAALPPLLPVTATLSLPAPLCARRVLLPSLPTRHRCSACTSRKVLLSTWRQEVSLSLSQGSRCLRCTRCASSLKILELQRQLLP